MNTITSTLQAIQTIVSMATLPPQIDYVSHAEKMKAQNAELFIQSLNAEEKAQAEAAISEQINNYYEPSFIGPDGKSYSAASLDAMF